MKKGIRGYVSIFMALIALPVFSIALVGVDISKIILLRSQLRQNNIMLLDSALSYYDRDLYRQYGLLALTHDKDDLNKSLKNIIDKNLYYNEDNFFKPKLRDISLLDVENDRLLGDNLQGQIISHMTYKMPLKISKGLINLINISIDQKKYHKVMDKKYSYDQAYSKMNISVDDLGLEVSKYEDSFKNINTGIKEIGKRFNKLRARVSSLKNKRASLEEDLKKIEKGSSEEKNVKNAIKNLSTQISQEIRSYNEDNKKLYKEAAILDVGFKKILSLLEGISEESKEIDEALSAWKKSLSSLDKSDIRDGFSNEINNASRKISGENIEKLRSKVKSHENTLPKIIDFLKTGNFYQLNPNQDLSKISINTGGLVNLPSFKNYKLYRYLLENSKMKKIERKEKKEAKSNRKQLNKLKDRLGEVSEHKTGETIYDHIDKVTIDNLEGLASSGKEINLDLSSKMDSYKGILKTVGSMIPDNLSEESFLYENLLISEYINDYFSNKIAKTEDGMVNQVEYILLGKTGLDRNNKSISNYILGLRFVLNSLYAFTNPKLIKEATSIAVAISGWTGFAVPLVKSLVLSSMSLGESVLDLEKINGGKNLEAFKNNSTWQVSVGGIKNILGSKLADVSKSAIDNFYEDILNLSDRSIDKVNAKTDEFIRQTIDGVSQQVISMLITPVQNKIENIINLEKEEIVVEMSKLFGELSENINQEANKNILDLKNEALRIVKSSVEGALLGNIEKFKNDLKYFENFFSAITKNVEERIIGLTSQAGSAFKREISQQLANARDYSKDKIEESINKFIGNFSGTGGKISYGAYSGLTFNYSDYLRLVSFLLLSSGDREAIIGRIGLMVDYNLKKENSNFDISKAYVKLKIQVGVYANTNIIANFFKREEILESVEGGY